jgi:hypothetical protein
MKWRQAHTDHFVVHYEKEIFAKKAARMAEFLYAYISDDLDGPEDLVEGRSQIFVFRNAERWGMLRTVSPEIQEWVFALVSGPEMYLQEAGNRRSSANVLAHEMTHLVLNRFFRKRIPVWLNEGLAEWYGEFGYAAFKGMKKSRKTEFKKLHHPYPIPSLMTAKEYPKEESIRAFYETSKFMVGFLRLSRPEETFMAFLKEVMSGREAAAALEAHYQLGDVAQFEKEFSKFLR